MKWTSIFCMSKESSKTEKRPSKETAARALAEAQERARLREVAQSEKMPKEFGGRRGPEPTRFGDWENKGIISDF